MKKIAVSLLALTLAVFLAAPAMAEFDPYGSVRLGVFWQTDEPAAAGADDDSDLVMPFGDFSRFGGKFKTGDLGGRVEFGLKGAENGNTVYQRLLYGTWDFGGGTLLVGQDYCPYTLVSAQVAPGFYDLDNGFIGYGALWNSRQPQIRVNMENGLYVGLIQPAAASTDDIIDLAKAAVAREKGAALTDPEEAAIAAVLADLDIDVTLPKICVGYELKTEDLSLDGGIAYNTFSAESETADFDESITSYMVYVGGKMGLGVVDLQANLHYGQNLGDFDITGREDAAYAQIDDDGDIEDSACMGGYVQAAFKVDPATITIGYGYTQSENDVAGDDADNQQSYFVNGKIPIADTFFVVPEYSYYDRMKDANGDKEDDTWYLGLKLQLNF